MRNAAILIAAVLLLAAGNAGVQVQQAWARATAPGQTTGAIYATLLSTQADTLLGVSSTAADAAMLHREVTHGGMASMQAIEAGLALPANRPVALSPGGRHIMLMGLKQPLVAGASVPVVLRFAKAGNVAISVPVEPLGATGPTIGPSTGATPAP